jgi:hypothetical protein
MGLLTGDTITLAGIGRQLYRKPEEIAAFVKRVDDEPPGLAAIGIQASRTMLVPLVGAIPLRIRLRTTKRDDAAFSLFLGTDREWVVWTPQGYYETSILGDSRFLGWHINPPFDTVRPTDFVSIATWIGSGAPATWTRRSRWSGPGRGRRPPRRPRTSRRGSSLLLFREGPACRGPVSSGWSTHPSPGCH